MSPISRCLSPCPRFPGVYPHVPDFRCLSPCPRFPGVYPHVPDFPVFIPIVPDFPVFIPDCPRFPGVYPHVPDFPVFIPDCPRFPGVYPHCPRFPGVYPHVPDFPVFIPDCPRFPGVYPRLSPISRCLSPIVPDFPVFIPDFPVFISDFPVFIPVSPRVSQAVSQAAGPCAAPALRLLQELRPQPELGELWEHKIPKLLLLLQENSEGSLDQEEWEEKLLQFLQESLESIPDKSWICPLVSEAFRQLRASDGSQEEKNFLYRCLGTALGLCPRKELVRRQLQELLESARCHEEAEREGLSSCFGICARNHLEETLEKLEEFEKSDVFKKSQGLFSIFKERGEGEQEKQRGALLLCWGRVAAAAPPELLRARLEGQLLPRLLRHARAKLLPRLLRHAHAKVLGIKVETKDPVLKLSLARSVSMICRALACGDSGKNSGKNSGNLESYPGSYPGNGPGNGPGSIAHKAELVALMVEFLRAEPPEPPERTRLRQRALSACAHLVYPGRAPIPKSPKFRSSGTPGNSGIGVWGWVLGNCQNSRNFGSSRSSETPGNSGIGVWGWVLLGNCQNSQNPGIPGARRPLGTLGPGFGGWVLLGNSQYSPNPGILGAQRPLGVPGLGFVVGTLGILRIPKIPGFQELGHPGE
ncbi:uncharacterized protein LOC135292423 [Passer domesticus]|uniref:uncharacterized protein LOC135292423 n=1 Tax=Passer domesticus TaxID=48849 RepID=UPI0030FE1CC7